MTGGNVIASLFFIVIASGAWQSHQLPGFSIYLASGSGPSLEDIYIPGETV